MKAAVSARYGDPGVIHVTEVAMPVPGPQDVLIRVHASTVNRTDCGMLEPHPFFVRLSEGLFRPKKNILGMDFAGTIEAVGSAVTAYAPGARVFGLSPDQFGTHAEYLCLSQDAPMSVIPDGFSFSQAVLCEGAWYADTNLRHFGIGHGHSILIYGGSGAIGSAAIQLAKAYGATVTSVVGTKHQELAASLGADEVINYQTDDFTATGQTFDFVFDAVGKTSYFKCRRLLKPSGQYAATDLGPGWQNIWLSMWYRLIGSNRVGFPMPKARRDMIDNFAGLMRDGKLRAVIDRTYPLEQIAKAYLYVQTAQKTGIVVIDPAQE